MLVGCAAMLVLAAGLPADGGGAATRPATHTHPLIGAPARGGVGPAVGARSGRRHDDHLVATGRATTTPPTGPSRPSPPPGSSRACARPARTFSDAAFWVGLDGDNSDTVEQIGTEGYSEGVAGYDAWYEMYPLYPVTIDMAIHPGDVLTGTVTWSRAGELHPDARRPHDRRSRSRPVQLMSVLPLLASAEVDRRGAVGQRRGDVVPALRLRHRRLQRLRLRRPADQRLRLEPDQHGLRLQRRARRRGPRRWAPTERASAVTTDVTPPTTTVSGAGARWHDAAGDAALPGHRQPWRPGGRLHASTRSTAAPRGPRAARSRCPLPADHSERRRQHGPLSLGRQGGQRREASAPARCSSTRAGRRPSPMGRRPPCAAPAPPCASTCATRAPAAPRRR